MQIAARIQVPAPARRRPFGWLRAARRDPLTAFGGAFFALMIVAAAFAPLITPYDPTKISVMDRFQAPSIAHPFGTDDFGRDVLARVLYGGRTIMITGFASVFGALIIGGGMGVIAGFAGGRVDTTLMRLTDIMLSFPAVLLAILIVASLGAGLVNTVIAIIFSLIPNFARLSRARVLQIMEEQYITASQSLGASGVHLIARHVVPNLVPQLIIQTTGMLAVAFSLSSALSFLGLGVDPSTPDWGLMVSEGQRLIFDAPHVGFFPGLAITLTILSVNFLGDGLRDRLDPARRGTS
jgi:ABC-type dipeptide/oligopeptide/nickel transport system permease subunit